MAAFDPASPAPRAPRAYRPYPHPPAHQQVRSLIMGDAQGEVQVLVASQALLDLAALARATGRELAPRPYRAQEPTSAIPGVYELPVVVEASLLSAGKLALATAEAGSFAHAQGTDLADVPGRHVTGTFAVTAGADPTSGDRRGDGEHIGITLSRFTERRIQARLDQTLHIPPLPEAARRIVALQADPDFDLKDLVRIVETDPSIAARIMGWANSAFYNPHPPAGTIDDAVLRVLGTETVMSMALGMALGQTLRLPDTQVRGLPSYWLEAVFTAAAMEAMARRMPRPRRPASGLCYLIGLLANFGALVVGHVFPHQYRTICALQEANRHLPHTYVDQYVLQMPREVLTAALLECWSLPEAVTEAIRFQYLPGYQGSNASYVKLLGLTRKLLGTQGLTDQPPAVPEPGELAELGLGQDDLTAVLALLNDASRQLDELGRGMGG